MEEETYQSGALAVDDVVGWAASLDPSPEVLHINLRSPSRNSYLGGKALATNLWMELRFRLPSLKFLHLTPRPATIDQLLNSMRTNLVGKPKDAHVQVYPTTNLVYTPPPIATWCARKILLQGHHLTILFSPSPGTLLAPVGGRIWASPLSIPPSNQRCTSPTSPTPPSTVQLLCNGTVVPHAPPLISSESPLRTETLPEPPHGVMGNPDPAPDRVGPSQAPLNFVDGNGYIVLRGPVEARDCEVGWGKVMKAWGSGGEKVVAKAAVQRRAE